MTPGIDAHQHVWTLARGDYGWLTPALAPIHRDFSMADLAPHLAGHGIGATILVQAAPTEAETAFLLEVATREAVVAGVVGWVELDAPDAAEKVAAAARNPLLVGLRPMVQDIADDDWLLRDALAPALDAMERHGLVFDALVLPRHLPRLQRVVERHPGLRVVLDHLGKPRIAEELLDPWRDDLARLAGRLNVSCKLSGLVTEAGPDWRVDALRPYIDHALDCFGAERTMWGSDWPVVELAGGYDCWRATTEFLLRNLTDDARRAVLGGTAARIYLRERGRKPC